MIASARRSGSTTNLRNYRYEEIDLFAKDGLVRVESQIAYVMVFGLPTPRPLEQAAKDHNYKVARVRRLARSQALRDYLAALEARTADDGQ